MDETTQSYTVPDAVTTQPQPLPPVQSYDKPEELTSALHRLGNRFYTEGMGAINTGLQEDERLRVTLNQRPETIRSISNNPNPKNDTPENIAVNGMARAYTTTEDIASSLKQQGINPRVLNNPEALQQQPGILDNIKSIFANAQAKPGSPQQIANEAYFGALTRGAGVAGAAQAYSQTYVQVAQQQAELQKVQLGKLMDYQIKTLDRAQQTRGIETNTLKMLSSSDSNLDQATARDISSQVGQISYMAKENPAGADIQARQLVQSMFENPNIDDRSKNKLMSTLVRSVQVPAEQQKQVDELRNAGLPDRVINKMIFGVSLEGEEASIKRVKDKIASSALARKLEQKQGETDIETAAAINKEIQLLPIKTQSDINKEAALSGVAAPQLAPTVVPMAPVQGSRQASGMPQPIVPQTTPQVSPQAVSGTTSGLPQPVAPTAQPTIPAQPQVTEEQPTGEWLKPIPNISVRAAQENIKNNDRYGEELGKATAGAKGQISTINRLESAIKENPEFWGIDTNSKEWRAYVDAQKNEDRRSSLDDLARNLNIPKEKRAKFDSVMNDYRNLQVNSITSSGLSASQLNTEKESQRIVNTIGSIADKPQAAQAALEYAKAKIEYQVTKERAWAEAQRLGGRINRTTFNRDFDSPGGPGEKIFERANERMQQILATADAAKPKRDTLGNPRPVTSGTSKPGEWKIIEVK